MRYLGGKSRVAPRFAPYFLTGSRVWEPFVGGFNIGPHLNPGTKLMCSDIHGGLIGMYNAIKKGWLPPTEITEQEYQELKSGSESALRTFASFGASFGGKEWGGFGRDAKGGRSIVFEAAVSLMEKVPWIVKADFECCSFLKIKPLRGDVVYCDPPYEGTQDYDSGFFDPVTFVKWCNAARDSGCRVFVSEFRNLCPDRWRIVWRGDRSESVGKSGNRTELLLEVA